MIKKNQFLLYVKTTKDGYGDISYRYNLFEVVDKKKRLWGDYVYKIEEKPLGLTIGHHWATLKEIESYYFITEKEAKKTVKLVIDSVKHKTDMTEKYIEYIKKLISKRSKGID